MTPRCGENLEANQAFQKKSEISRRFFSHSMQKPGIRFRYNKIRCPPAGLRAAKKGYRIGIPFIPPV
jgi:hypothetical protein